MSQLSLTAGPRIGAFASLVLENRYLRVVVLPEAGGKIWQIHYRPLGAELLWNNPSQPPTPQALHASYDDAWSGGWDELFPNDEACVFLGLDLPDHGELWSSPWQSHHSVTDEAVSLTLNVRTRITQFQAEKTLILAVGSRMLEVRYRLVNLGIQNFPFLFKLHPAFAVSASHRLDFPRMTVNREPDFPGTLAQAPLRFEWPHAMLGDVPLDLRRIPPPTSGATHFFYGTELAAGWCGITNCSTGLAAALCYDPAVFSSCWLFATHGGWRDLNVAVLEPATGYPFKLHTMIDLGQARFVEPGGTLETTVLFSLREGIQSITGVDGSGDISGELRAP